MAIRTTTRNAAVATARNAAVATRTSPAQHIQRAPMPTQELRGRAEAPVRPDVHTNSKESKERIAQAARAVARDASKAANAARRAALVAELSAGRRVPKAGELAELRSEELRAVCKARQLRGYSALRTDELRALLATGRVPTPEKDSARDLRARARDCKAKGLISGPVSAISVGKLESVVKAAEGGKAVEVAKPAPNKGTADWHKNLLREGLAKGFSARATAAAKSLYGAKASISTLKAAQLKAVCQALGLVK